MPQNFAISQRGILANYFANSNNSLTSIVTFELSIIQILAMLASSLMLSYFLLFLDLQKSDSRFDSWKGMTLDDSISTLAVVWHQLKGPPLHDHEIHAIMSTSRNASHHKNSKIVRYLHSILNAPQSKKKKLATCVWRSAYNL
jgi:hypothetical protein